MPKNPSWSLGKTKRNSVKTTKYYETFPTFWEICHDTKIKMPRCQHALNENKYKDMAEEYRKDRFKFLYKDTIVIGVLNNTPYLVDGQHRVEMCRYLVNTYGLNNPEIEQGTFRFCYNLVDNENQLRDLFESVNHDSQRNSWYLSQDDMVKIKMEEFNKQLQDKYKRHFANTIIKNPYKYTIPEFIKTLQNYNVFSSQESAHELVSKLGRANDNYVKFYTRELKENQATFHQLDLKQIETGIVFSLLRNNFIEWFIDSNTIFFHQRKGNKKRITRKLKIACWEKNYPNCDEVECPIPNCTLILSKNNFNTWQAGHIISEKNKGETKINNLKPICPSCNSSMGSKNWDQYIGNY